MLQMEHYRRKLLIMQSATEFVNSILELQGEDKIKVIILLWQWWNDKIRKEGKAHTNNEISFSIISQTNEYCQAFLKDKGQKKIQQGRWTAPMLVNLAMDLLQGIVEKATREGILKVPANLKISLYVDDAALFLNPIKSEITTIQAILNLFGEASGLKTNLQKSIAYVIQSEGIGCQAFYSR